MARSRLWPTQRAKRVCSFNFNEEKIIVAEENNIVEGGGQEQPAQPAPAAPQAPSAPPVQPQQHQAQQPYQQRGGGGRGGHARGRRKPPGEESTGPGGEELTEKVVFINRSAKVVKGGRRFNFSALIVVGDRKGKVGVGLGKAGEVADAIRKGGEDARNHMVPVSLKDATIPHEVLSRHCGAKILMRPASPGTGIIAGKTVRAVLESAGVKDILTKSLGSNNAANVVKATLNGLLSLRLREEIYKGRGLEIRKAAAPKAPEATPAV
jgi:small subunit ribosomal protein S5